MLSDDQLPPPPKSPEGPPRVNPDWLAALEEAAAEMELLKRQAGEPASAAAEAGAKALRPYSDRRPQRLSNDEIARIVRPLPEPWLISDVRIAAGIDLRAVQYLREKEHEQRARHPSKLRRDLLQGAGRFSKALEWFAAESPNRRRSSGIGRIDSALAWLDGLDQRQDLWPSLGIAGEPEHDPALAAARRALRAARDVIAAHASAPPDLAPVADMRDLVRGGAAVLDASRGEKASHRRSTARRRFLDRLADLFEAATGRQATYRWDDSAGHSTSPFAQFALTALKTVDPEAAEHQRGIESDIQAVVGRGSRRRQIGEELTEIEVYDDPCDRKLSRRRIRPR